MSVNILPGSLTVTGDVSTATAGIGGNLVVGGNITVTGNLYSANVTVSGGGGAGVSSITAASGITSSGSTGAVTISAVVANVVGVSGIGVSQAGGTFTVGISGEISNTSTASNSIGGVILSNNTIDVDQIVMNAFTLSDDGADGFIEPGGGASYFYLKGTGGSNLYLYKDQGRISNSTSSSNNIGGVVLSNAGISNVDRIRDSGPSGNYIDIQAGDCNSRLNSFRFDSSGFSGTGGKIYPIQNGTIQITGNSTGANPLTINDSGALNNTSTTSNSIGGVVLSNGIITPSHVSASSPGYVRLGPIMFQWGYANVTTNTSLTVTFPVAHSSAAWNIVFSPANTAAGNQINNAICNVTSSNFEIVTGADALNAYWQSIGPA